ncbi:MAG: TIGR03936 family radical SAM-associated protein [Eubacteriales bacterium]
MTVIRIKFSKGEEIKYISHLDLQRCFQRLFRRAELEMIYSQGFNPHPKVSFAMAMPVGMTSQGDYLDVEVPGKISAKEVQESLNKVAPRGLKIIQVQVIEGQVKALSASITQGIFHVRIPTGENCAREELQNILDSILGQEAIEIEKKNKKGKLVVKDIRPLVKNMTIVTAEENFVVIEMKMCIGSMENLNPQVLVDYMIHQYACLQEFPKAKIHRIEMLLEEDITPISMDS